MSVPILLKSLSRRIHSWKTITNMLHICDLPVGQGREKTIKILQDKSKVGEELNDKFDELKKLYHHHILIGQKAVKIFQLQKNYIDKIITLLQSHQIEHTVFQKYYPFLIPEENLTEIDLLPKLVYIEETSESLSLIFCTRRSFTERTEIDIKAFNTEVQNKLVYYDKIFGTKRHIYQFFDVIVVWKNKNVIEVRIDIVNNFSSQERHNSFVRIIEQFNNLIYESLGIENILEKCVNFFPLINNLYNSKSEGKIIELSFTTDEGSIKSEKIRKDKVDLRDETYHKAGRDAVHHITPYHIAILWDFEIPEGIKTQIELVLPGKFYILSSENPSLEEAIIDKCGVLEEYNFIFNKIDTYLNHVT